MSSRNFCRVGADDREDVAGSSQHFWDPCRAAARVLKPTGLLVSYVGNYPIVVELGGRSQAGRGARPRGAALRVHP